MSEVKRYMACIDGIPVGRQVVLAEDFDALQQRLTVAERERDAALAREDALRNDVLCLKKGGQLIVQDMHDYRDRLTVAEQRAGELECFSVKQAALLDELGIPLDEVDDLFGETLKNARRYEYLRSVMAIENFPDPHPEWSEPSEVESKRIDDLCDAALKPAEAAAPIDDQWEK